MVSLALRGLGAGLDPLGAKIGVGVEIVVGVEM